MDQKTVDYYDANASELTNRYSNETPEKLYSLAKAFFIKDEMTLNLGSGSGRDSVWLEKNNYPCTSVDASQGMIDQSLAKYPELKNKILKSYLPNLEKLNSDCFQNVFCSAVLMHLPTNEIIPSINGVLRIAKDGGIIIISWRNSLNGEAREGERLFENYSISRIAQLFEAFGGQVLFEESSKDEASGKTWLTLIVRKSKENLKTGLKKIQDILERDRKVSTYKFALIRALCNIAKYEPAIVIWENQRQQVAVPKIRIAYWWMGYYWNLVEQNKKQIQGGRNLKFEISLQKEIQQSENLPFAMKKFDNGTITKKLVSELCSAIDLPVTHAGGGNCSIFESNQGLVMVPAEVWRDISRYSYWIEDTLVVRWAEFLRDLHNKEDASEYLAIIAKPIFPKRDTNEIRQFLEKNNVEKRCIWSGDRIEEYDVDHCIPYSVWKNNDIWNLLPAKKSLNISKSDMLPHPDLVSQQFDHILYYWEHYSEHFGELFFRQIERALELKTLEKSKAKDALIFRIQHMHFNQGTGYWAR